MLMSLPVLPPPYSTSLYPELSRKQRREWRSALRARNRCCFWCGQSLDRVQKTLDHVVPLNRGGTNTADNFVISCMHCNSVKSNAMPMEWLQRLESVLAHLREVVPKMV